MSWSNQYVGIPHCDHGRSVAGADCWGLLRLIYKDRLGIRLPSYAAGYMDTEERAVIAQLISSEAAELWRLVAEIEPYDALLFRRGQHACHVGVAVTAQHMIHIAGGEQARHDNIEDPRFKLRFKGAYRYTGARS